MKRAFRHPLILGIFAVVGLGAALSVAQIPQTLPANTVIGRLGINSGPPQAIPLTTLFAQPGAPGVSSVGGNTGAITAAQLKTTLGSPVAGSRVHNNGVDLVYNQPSPNNYIRFSPSTAAVNQNSLWSSFQYTPPTGARGVDLSGTIWIRAGAASSGNYVAKWVKNFTVNGGGFLLTGADVCSSGQGAVAGGTAGQAIMHAACYDAPSTSDYYGLFVFVDANGGAGNPITIDGNGAHSFVSPKTILW